MTSINVKTLLFISSADKSYCDTFLFHCAKYYAEKGVKVLYITQKPIETLPSFIGKPKTVENMESMRFIQFVYLPEWQDMLKHCYSIHLERNPASVIIVHELENYCVSDKEDGPDQASLVCASLLQAASMSATINSKTSYLVTNFNSTSSTIPRTLCKSFFHNVWELIVEEETDTGQRKLIKLSRLSPSIKSNQVKLLVFSENDEQSFLDYESAFEEVICSSE